MWDRHHCPDATERVGEMAPRMNEVVRAARARGIQIIHCPSDTMEFYKDHPGRKLAQSAPKVDSPVPLQNWCSLNTAREAGLPIDDSDGGCDGCPECPGYRAWSREHPALEIAEGDAITDSAEAYYLMRQRGITNVIVMGVHINMCVLGRPFSIRQMVAQGQNVVLMRDMTDSMYNHRKAPFVSHFRGTEMVVEHIERYWCPSITSVDFLGGQPFRFRDDIPKRVVMIIGENEYQTWETLPEFARSDLAWRGLKVDYVMASPKEGDPNFKDIDAIRNADLLVVSARRRTPPKAMLELIRAHLAAGKPLVGIRTASHAFDHQIGSLPARTEFGAQLRHDRIRVGLFDTQARQIVGTTRDDDVQETMLALYGQTSVEWTPWLRSVVGLRADQARFEVTSLSNAANSGSASGHLLSPKLSLVLGPWAKTEFFFNAGRGFHSNDARGTTATVDPKTNDPVEKVPGLVAARGLELGARTEWLPGLQSSLALWKLDFDSELVYVGDAGATEANRPSTRRGVEWNNRYVPRPWLLVDADLAWTHARFDDGARIPNAVDQVASVAVTARELGPWSAGIQCATSARAR